MKKIMIFGAIIITVFFISCQKEYVCFCTKVNTGAVKYQDKYVGTFLTKTAAKNACNKNLNLETDTLTNCHIE